MMRVILLSALAIALATAAEAGPFVQAFAAFNAWVSGLSATALFAVRIGFSLALSALATALQKSPEQRRGGIKTEATTTGGTTAQSFILGRYATAGHMDAPPYSHPNSGGVPNEFLTYVLSISDLPGVTLSRAIVAGEYVEGLQASAGDHDYEGLLEDVPGVGLDVPHFFLTWHDGSQVAADAYMIANYADHPDRPWSADMIGTGLTYAVVTFRYNRKLFNQLPGVRFEVDGVPLYDPRADGSVSGTGTQRWNDPATWAQTDNPAVMIYNILRGIALPDGSVWGGRAQADDLPLDVWFTAMNACDAPVTLKAGGTEPRYRAGLEVSVDQSPASVIEELLKACSGEIAEIGGVYKIRVGGPGLPVFFFTDDDVVADADQSLVPYPGLDQVHNGIHATHPAPDALWESRDAPPRYDTDAVAEDGGRELVASVELNAVYSDTQVQRLMRAWLKDERRFRRHGLTLPPDAAVIEPLDSIAWTSAEEGYTAKVFEVAEASDDLVTCLQSLSIRERDATDFNWTPASDEIDVYHPPTAVTVPAPRTVTGFAVEAGSIRDGANAERRPAVKLSWSTAGVRDRDSIRWQVQIHGVQTVAEGVIDDPTSGFLWVTEGILPSTTYQARAKIRAREGSVWTAWASATTADVRLAESDIPASVNQAVVDFNAISAGFAGTLVDLQVDAAAAQQAGLDAAQAALDSDAARLASETARDAAQNARDNAQTSATNAGNSATAASGSASSAQTSANTAGASASVSEGQAIIASTSAAEAARTAALAGPSILALPAAQWTRQSVDAVSDILKPGAAVADFVTGDAEFGEAFEFPDGSNTTIGQAWPYDWNDTAVYSVRVRFKVVSDGNVAPDAGGAPGVQYRVGGTVQVGTSVLAANVQDGGQVARVSDGLIEREVWFSRRTAASMPALPSGVVLVTFSATADGGNRFYPHLRQNYTGGTTTNGILRVGDIELRNITALVDGMLAEEAAFGSATAAATSASAASASETAAGASASAAETSRVNADTARAQAQVSATSAATSATNAAGSASTATTQANLAATARNSAQAYAADASNSATDAATAKSGADSASATAVSARDLAVAASLSAENLAIQMLPSDFQEDGRYFTSTVAGAPGSAPVDAAWSFVDSTNEGRVARISVSSGTRYLLTAGLIKPVAGRTYRLTVRGDLGGTVSGSPDISLFFRELDASYGYVAAHGFTSFDVTFAFNNYSIEFTPSTDMAYLRAGFYTRSEMTGTGFFQCSSLLVEDVTESKAALASATSASASASSAASARDTAVSSASTATTQANLAATAKNDAVTARSGAQIAETNAVNAKVAAETAKNGAETARSGAEFARNVAASISGGGDVENPLFIEPSSNPTATPSGFYMLGGSGSTIARVATGNKYGNGPCIEYTTGSTLSASLPYIIINHTSLGGLAASDVEAVEIDFEFEMISGTWGSAHIVVNWWGSTYSTRKVYLKDAITSRNGKVQRVTAVLERPADYVAGTTDDLRVIFYGNVDGDANGETNHNARIHRFDYQVLSTYAASLLNQRAVADLEGNALASFVMRAKAGAALGSVEIIAATSAANGGASASKVTLTADEIELAGDATIFSGNEIKSSNFAAGVSGWRIRNGGDAEFNNIIDRSDIVDGAVSVGAYDADTTGRIVGTDSNLQMAVVTLGPVDYDQYWKIGLVGEHRGDGAGVRSSLFQWRRRTKTGTTWSAWSVIGQSAANGTDVWQQKFFFHDFIGKFDDVQFEIYAVLNAPAAQWSQNNIRRTHLIARSNPAR
ncbi:hypothetical protein [Roseicyclus sp.]|uniref:hypothetical protein n=1 Tax=Roseicyclus sp. TaxID=1914329 RepID=UPI003F6D3FEC